MADTIDKETRWRLIGYWSRVVRHLSNWSQEAVAAEGGITLRTVQRIEAGAAISITNLRGLARGLGYTDQTIFENPEMIANIRAGSNAASKAELDKLAAQHPDMRPLDATEVTSGTMACRLADNCNMMSLTYQDDVAAEAKEVAAEFFDFLHDLKDILADISLSERLQYEKDLDEVFDRLKAAGGRMFSASEPLTMRFPKAPNPTPMRVKALYICVGPASKAVGTLFVAREPQFSF